MGFKLTLLRNKIDEIDKEILKLLSHRMALVSKIGKIKNQCGIPIYVPEREDAIVALRRREAESMDISPDFIEDIFRRIMHESYSKENNRGFKAIYFKNCDK